MSAYEWGVVAGLFALSTVLSYAVLRHALRRGAGFARGSPEPTTPPEIPDAAEHADTLAEARSLRARSEGLLERVSAGRSLNDASAKAAETIADIYDTEL